MIDPKKKESRRLAIESLLAEREAADRLARAEAFVQARAAERARMLGAVRLFVERFALLALAWIGLAAVVLLLYGCGPSRSVGVPVGRLRVTCPADMPQDEVALVLSSIAVQLAAFEHDFGPISPEHVTVFDDPPIVNGETVAGFNWSSDGRPNLGVWIWRGPANQRDACWGMYHELAHGVFGPGHSLGVWQAVIFPRTDALAAEISRSRGGS